MLKFIKDCIRYDDNPKGWGSKAYHVAISRKVTTDFFLMYGGLKLTIYLIKKVIK